MKPVYLVFLLFTVSVISGCSTTKIQNMENMAVPNRSPHLSLDNVESAISSACEFLDWELKLLNPGRAIATHRARSHVAQVLIEYTPRNYSINYHDSVNLKHDGDSIHGVYNQWVEDLDKKIQKELTLVEASHVPAAVDQNL